ncbi:MAG: hypothetical protein JWM47_911 [Acidimicrobiales bacterium]|nr:hypothetical protein [Acidimicrobiales bacterium]
MTTPAPRPTGTPDDHYDLILVLQQALEDAKRYECFAVDADGAADSELAGFFRELAASDREIAERAKAMLLQRLAGEAVPGGVRP